MKSAAVASPAAHDISIFDLRRRARRRAWICPGAGFASCGLGIAAALTYVSALATLVTAIALAWSPSGPLLTATLALLIVGTIGWLAEITTTCFAWTTPAAVNAAARYRLKAAILWLLVATFAGIVAVNYRALEVGGDGMSPTIHQGDRLLYRRGAHSRDLTPGKLILFRLAKENKFAEAGTLVLARILAVPGSTMQVREGMYYVNGRAEHPIARTGDYPPVITIASPPGTTPVLKDGYFVVQDSREGGLDSRVLSLAHREDILSAEFYSLSSFPPLKRIE